jgi:hypothetical protein
MLTSTNLFRFLLCKNFNIKLLLPANQRANNLGISYCQYHKTSKIFKASTLTIGFNSNNRHYCNRNVHDKVSADQWLIASLKGKIKMQVRFRLRFTWSQLFVIDFRIIVIFEPYIVHFIQFLYNYTTSSLHTFLITHLPHYTPSSLHTFLITHLSHYTPFSLHTFLP